MPAESILLADEDAGILEAGRFYLEREGYKVFSVKAGFDALNSTQTIHPDLIVLGMDLPGLDGFEVCSRLRRENNQVPILAVFSSEKQLRATIQTLVEVDDFLIKPFPPREMVSRVTVLLRPRKPRSKKLPAVFEIGSVALDANAGSLRINDRKIAVRKLDLALLVCLMSEAGKFVTMDHLVNDAWGGDDFQQTLGVEMHIALLQRLLAGSGVNIQFDPHAGYKLTA